ncbi:MAG: PD40 domain-containing protein, partial [Deltaproteobacteria bacterium]|nr:PD40 domain-containing protein [Deltaproteobacteria bacterium]
MRAPWLLILAGCYTGSTPPSTNAIAIGEPAHETGLVFVSGREAQDHWSATQIFLAKPSAQQATNLTNDARWNSSPAISPDGTRMAFIKERSLRIMRLADGEERTVDVGDGPFGCVRWAGHRLAYVAPANTRGSAVWVVSEHGGSATQLTNPGAASDELVTFIDHGRRVVFDRYDSATSDRDLWVIDADGGSERRLTSTTDIAETLPVASHDGRLLAYRAFRASHDGIRVMSLADGAIVQDWVLPAGLVNISGIDFAADDQALVFGADDEEVGGSLENVKGELFRAGLDGSGLVRLTKNASYDGQPA